MRTDEYTDDEVETKDKWDKLFWIELAKRKERLITGDAHRMLVQLHDQIAQAIDTPGQVMDEPIEGIRGLRSFWTRFSGSTTRLMRLMTNIRLSCCGTR